jgi:hypothetical protein
MLCLFYIVGQEIAVCNFGHFFGGDAEHLWGLDGYRHVQLSFLSVLE